jgi:methylated-DNA-[protein]-cysteine S-methyltransferase
MMRVSYFDSPVGRLTLVSDGAALTALHLPAATLPATGPRWPDPSADAVLDAALAQLGEYFGGGRRDFALPLDARGTAFQRAVWSALREIPYGTTASYGAIAARVGRPRAVRAVGAANGRNPLAIVIPCHRIIGSDGGLTGYGGGLPTKRWLLAHERGLTDGAAGDDERPALRPKVER